MDLELPSRILAAARSQAPTPRGGKLMPHRAAVLTHLAKGSSYEKIAAFFKKFGVQVEASAVGHFCRRHCPEVDIERTRRELIASASSAPVPAPMSASPQGASPRRHNPRIARDDL